MTKTGNTRIGFLLDRTGSMADCHDETVGAFNAYIEELKNAPKGLRFTMVQFDSQSTDFLHTDAKVKDVPVMKRSDFEPRGLTPLIDASMGLINHMREIAKKGDKVIVCIQTDGHENASKEHTWDHLKQTIQKLERKGWQFVFLGAGIDAYKQGAMMGIGAGNTVSYDKRDARATADTFRNMAANTMSLAAGSKADMSFTADQKAAAKDIYQPKGQDDAYEERKTEATDGGDQAREHKKKGHQQGDSVTGAG